MNIYDLLKEQAVNDNIFSLVVGGVVIKNNKVLLLKRSDDRFMQNFYEFPSGKLEFGETIEECLYRHINEELNVNVKTIKNYIGFFDYLSKNGKSVRQYNFEIELCDEDKISLSNEHSDMKYFNINDCSQLIDISDEVYYTISMTISNKVLGGKIYEH